MLLLPVAESDSEEEEEEEEFDSEGEVGKMSSQSSGRRYPSRSKNSRSTRLTRNSAGADRKRTGKRYQRCFIVTSSIKLYGESPQRQRLQLSRHSH